MNDEFIICSQKVRIKRSQKQVGQTADLSVF